MPAFLIFIALIAFILMVFVPAATLLLAPLLLGLPHVASDIYLLFIREQVIPRWIMRISAVLALVGLATLILILIVAIFAPFVSPQNPYNLAQLDIMDSKLPPGGQSMDGMTFWLGSDDQGRDMLSAIFYGLRISLGVGTLATVCALAIGLVVGLIAAWFGGWVETVIMRLVDLQLSFPSILIALVLLAGAEYAKTF